MKNKLRLFLITILCLSNLNYLSAQNKNRQSSTGDLLKSEDFNIHKLHFGLGIGFGIPNHSEDLSSPTFSFNANLDIPFSKNSSVDFNIQTAYIDIPGKSISITDPYTNETTTIKSNFAIIPILIGVKGYLSDKVHIGGNFGIHSTTASISISGGQNIFSGLSYSVSLAGVAAGVDAGYLIPVGKKGHGLDLSLVLRGYQLRDNSVGYNTASATYTITTVGITGMFIF